MPNPHHTPTIARALAMLGRDFARFAGSRLWLLLALMVGGSIAEGFGLLMIVPLAAIALGEVARLPQWVAGPLERLDPDQALAMAAALFLLAMALRSVLLVWRDSLRGRLEASYRASLQLRAAATLAEAGWNKASRIGQAGMQSLLLNDVPRAILGLAYLLEVAVAGIFLAVQLSLAAFLSPALALFAVVVLAPALILLRGTTRRLGRSGEALTRGAEDSTAAGIRLHSGLKSALAQGSVAPFLGEYRSSLERLAGEYSRFTRDLALSRQLSAFATGVAAVLLLLAGARFLELPFAVLAASLVLFARMAAPAVGLLQSAQQAIAMAPAFSAIERRLGPLRDARITDEANAPPLDWSRLDLDETAYRHDSGRGVGPITLSLERGMWLGLRGPSAAGKTTLADLIACLHHPQQGSMTVDGKALDRQRLEQWRAGIAYLGQDGLVFADSVAANLTAGQSSIDEVAMWEALESVGLAGRVRSFPDGLHHPLGEGGSTLSGGERQRLLIARAMLRRPTLIILDEATAALDPDAEAGVLSALHSLGSRPAAILIAHRESTLGHCQNVIDLQHSPSASQ
jgi:ABC-type multidrug transport system fused ATPase/permease subunit